MPEFVLYPTAITEKDLPEMKANLPSISDAHRRGLPPVNIKGKLVLIGGQALFCIRPVVQKHHLKLDMETNRKPV